MPVDPVGVAEHVQDWGWPDYGGCGAVGVEFCSA
jgi:hypothetical protein